MRGCVVRESSDSLYALLYYFDQKLGAPPDLHQPSGGSGADTLSAADQFANDLSCAPHLAALNILFDMLMGASGNSVQLFANSIEAWRELLKGGRNSLVKDDEEENMNKDKNAEGAAGLGEDAPQGPRTVAVPIGASLTPQERAQFLRDAQNVLMGRLLSVFSSYIVLEGSLKTAAAHGQAQSGAMKRFYLAQIFQALNRLQDPGMPVAFVKALFKPLTKLILCEDVAIRKQLVMVFEKVNFSEEHK